MRRSLIWGSIGRQLRYPIGVGGRLVGHAMSVVNREPNRVAIAALNVGPADRVLELGFGPGKAIRVLSSMVPEGRVLGIDQSEVMLLQATRRNRGVIRSGRVQIQRGCFDKLPLESDSVDKILAVNVVYFFHSDGAEIREALRVLRPGGGFAVYVTEKSSMEKWKFSSRDTHRTFDRSELSAFLQRGGFVADKISILPVSLTFGVKGLVAVMRK